MIVHTVSWQGCLSRWGFSGVHVISCLLRSGRGFWTSTARCVNWEERRASGAAGKTRVQYALSWVGPSFDKLHRGLLCTSLSLRPLLLTASLAFLCAELWHQVEYSH